MKNIRSHFVFNRSQRNGIFLLVLIIIILQGFYFFGNFATAPEVSSEDPEVMLFQQQVDSMRVASAAGDTVKIFPFNPNFITDYRGYVLGMSIEEIDKLLAFRAEDKWVNSPADFQQVTGVSDSLLGVIAPNFRFPEWVTREKPSAVRSRVLPNENQRGVAQKQDLNAASAQDLMEIKGVGEVLAGRMVNYRSKIGGFLDDLQLKDIYGLNYEVRNEVLTRFTVKNAPEINLLNINTASILELSEVPYINYELAREIVNYRLLHEKINTFEELANIKDFPSEKIDRIALYLTFK